MVRPFRRGMFSRVGLNVVSQAVLPQQVEMDALRRRVQDLLNAAPAAQTGQPAHGANMASVKRYRLTTLSV